VKPSLSARLALLSAAVLACSTASAADTTPVDEARTLAAQLATQLGAALRREMATGGPEVAVAVCRQLAPEIAGTLSRQAGLRLARVSLKPRNPMLGQPDAWEQAVLAEFDRRAAAGEKPESIEHHEMVDEPQGRHFRYLKAIPVQPLCLACHGPAESLSAAVRERLAAEYPFDRAVGYAPGQVRGAITLKKRIEGQ
jgi:hypothetical protein